MMDKLTNFLENKLSPMFAKFADNKYLQAISGSFFRTLPVIIIGSVFTLIANFPIKVYINFLKSVGIYEVLNSVGNATTNSISLFTAFFAAFCLADKFKVKGKSACGLLGLVSFLILTPMSVTVEGVEKPISAISTTYFGSNSLFVALIVGLVIGRIYIFVTEKGWEIKMPAGVPQMVANSFSSIIAGVITITFTVVVHAIFVATPYGNIHSFITEMVQAPMLKLGNSFWFFVGLYMFMNLCWFFGIHGAAVYAAVQPIVVGINLQNLEAFQVGAQLPNMYANWVLFLKIGGLGTTVGLCIFMAFRARSNRYKSLGRMALIPSLFNINEPLCFGMPLMLNPMMFLPLVLNPLVTGTIAYFAMSSGLVGYTTGASLPWTTPPLINSFLQGGVGVMLLQLVCLLVATAMYIPFFKVLDKKAVEEESKIEAGVE